MKARLFARLREHFQRRDGLRLVIDYRRKYLESLVRQGEEEAATIKHEYRQADAQTEQEYAGTAAAMAEKKELSGDEAGEVRKLSRKLVGLYHPDGFTRAGEAGDLSEADRRDQPREGQRRFQGVARDRRRPGASSFCGKAGQRSISRKSARSRNCAGLWGSIELEIVRVLEAGPRVFQ